MLQRLAQSLSLTEKWQLSSLNNTLNSATDQAEKRFLSSHVVSERLFISIVFAPVKKFIQRANFVGDDSVSKSLKSFSDHLTLFTLALVLSYSYWSTILVSQIRV